MTQTKLEQELTRSLAKLGQLIKPEEADLPKSIQYLENGGVLVTIFKGRKTITRALFEDGIFAEGYSKCDPEDKYNRKIGMEISRARTYRYWAVKKEMLWVARAKPENAFPATPLKYRIAYGLANTSDKLR